jgi:hypothetical protein
MPILIQSGGEPIGVLVDDINSSCSCTIFFIIMGVAFVDAILSTTSIYKTLKKTWMITPGKRILIKQELKAKK